jgi:hypothetical protein
MSILYHPISGKGLRIPWEAVDFETYTQENVMCWNNKWGCRRAGISYIQ